jgi:hypothetical protein
VDEYEILVGEMRALRWVSTEGKFNLKSLGCRPVEGGHEKDGTPVYIVRAQYKDASHPGKTTEELAGAPLSSLFRISYTEKFLPSYRCLHYIRWKGESCQSELCFTPRSKSTAIDGLVGIRSSLLRLLVVPDYWFRNEDLGITLYDSLSSREIT